MRRRAVPALVAAVAGSLALPGTAATAQHQPLPRRLGVDEREYWVYPTHNPVASGRVEFDVTNFGMDMHDFSVRDAHDNVLSSTPLASGATAVVSIKLTPGRYTLFCSLSNHEALGMHARLTVKLPLGRSRTRGVSWSHTRGAP
jgi:plastocyanin